MLSDDFLALTGFTYEAALDPNLWPLVLARGVEVFSGHSAALLGLQPQSGELRFEFSHGMEPARRRLLRQRLLAMVPTTRKGQDDGVPVSLIHDICYTSGVRDAGSGAAEQTPVFIAARLQVDEDLGALVAFELETTEPARVERISHYARHLERALQVGYRMRILGWRAESAEQVLDRLPIGVFTLSGGGEVAFINRAARSVLNEGDGLYMRRGLLRARDTEDDAALRAAVRAASKSKEASEQVVLVRRRGRAWPLTVAIASTGPANASILGPQRAALTVYVTDPDRRQAPSLEVLRTLYGLTEMEARVAALLVAGSTLEEAATRLSIARGTVRVHLERIFRKTGTHRQPELVRVLLTAPMLLD